jgi:hypothetical protein
MNMKYLKTQFHSSFNIERLLDKVNELGIEYTFSKLTIISSSNIKKKHMTKVVELTMIKSHSRNLFVYFYLRISKLG